MYTNKCEIIESRVVDSSEVRDGYVYEYNEGSKLYIKDGIARSFANDRKVKIPKVLTEIGKNVVKFDHREWFK